MAYGRSRGAPRKGSKGRKAKKASSRWSGRRTGSTRRAQSGTRKRSGTGRRDTVTIRVIQEGPQQLSPLTQQLLDSKKIQLPRRARF